MNAIGDSAKNAVVAVVQTVEQSAIAAKKTVEVLNTAIDTTNTALQTTDSVLKLGKTTVDSASKNVNSLGNATSSAIDNSSQVANSALNTLNDKLKLTNEVTNNIIGFTNDFIKTASKSATVIGESTVTTIEFGAIIVSTLTSIISYPFERLTKKIDEIKKTNEKVEAKINKLQKIDIQNFEYTKKSMLTGFKNGVNSYMALIKIAIKSLKEIGCQPGYISYRCNEDIRDILKNINILIRNVINDQTAFSAEITNLFNEYPLKIKEYEYNLSGNDDNAKIENWEKNVSDIKSKIINTAIAKYDGLIDKFNPILKNIYNNVNELKEEIMNNIKNKQTKKLVDVPNLPIMVDVENHQLPLPPSDSALPPPPPASALPPPAIGGSKRATKSKRSKKSISKRTSRTKTKRVKRRV